MAFTVNKKAFCVLEFAKTESIVTVQRRFRIMYHTEPPTDKTIREWYMNSSRVAACSFRAAHRQPRSFLPCPSWLLRIRVRKSRRDLWITPYVKWIMGPEWLRKHKMVYFLEIKKIIEFVLAGVRSWRGTVCVNYTRLHNMMKEVWWSGWPAGATWCENRNKECTMSYLWY